MARARRKKAGLGKWFGEKWVDVKTSPVGAKAGVEAQLPRLPTG